MSPLEFPLPTRHADLPLAVAWFPTAKPNGPALGDPERTTWSNFAGVFWYRREDDEKDGPCFIPARFKPEADSRQVRRLGRNVLARSAIAMDLETNTDTGEVPPSFAEAVIRVGKTGWAAVIYTSHSHSAGAPRYRIVILLSEEIDPELPAVEVIQSLEFCGGPLLERTLQFRVDRSAAERLRVSALLRFELHDLRTKYRHQVPEA